MKQLCDICAGVKMTPFGECSNCHGEGTVNWLDNIIKPFQYDVVGPVTVKSLCQYVQFCFETICLHYYFIHTLDINEVKIKMKMIMDTIKNYGLKFDNYQLFTSDPNYYSFVLYFTQTDYHEFLVKR